MFYLEGECDEETKEKIERSTDNNPINPAKLMHIILRINSKTITIEKNYLKFINTATKSLRDIINTK